MKGPKLSQVIGIDSLPQIKNPINLTIQGKKEPFLQAPKKKEKMRILESKEMPRK